MPSPHQVVVFSMERVGFSKALSAISSHSPTSLAGKILALEIGFYHSACIVWFWRGWGQAGRFYFVCCLNRIDNFPLVKLILFNLKLISTFKKPLYFAAFKFFVSKHLLYIAF